MSTLKLINKDVTTKLFPELTEKQSQVLMFWALGGNLSAYAKFTGLDLSNLRRTLVRCEEKLNVKEKQLRSLILMRVIVQ
ncbi:hypothetical protein [Aliivibrio sifiae]|uniref:HTH luxR-type domain-containing protein n=1 Tax=Aliivibrio sifiae TaxID=566293 RepID=A0A2S7X141_9GAMM|nr:hypothetical protein [Aliivibrio sifiae]PQJ83526.1 hypothetical protein BTO23_20505 [Aliivibrio sifiae]GLR76842.1 hypothetical protein GCM10007855_37170 [Aliivibrio sifiae]